MAEALVNVRNGVAVRCPVAAARFELPPPSSSSAFPLEPKLDRAIRLFSKMEVSLNPLRITRMTVMMSGQQVTGHRDDSPL